MQNNFGFNLISKNYIQKKCGYKDINNQIELIECDKVQLSNYICQKKIEKRITFEYETGD